MVYDPKDGCVHGEDDLSFPDHRINPFTTKLEDFTDLATFQCLLQKMEKTSGVLVVRKGETEFKGKTVTSFELSGSCAWLTLYFDITTGELVSCNLSA